MDCIKIKTIISDVIRRQVDTAVVGLSGGADSLLVALLSREALGPENVYTYSFPSCDHDFAFFNRNSEIWARHIGVRHAVAPIGPVADRLNATLAAGLGLESAEALTPLNAGNSRARIRMALLYGIAHHLGVVLKNRVRVMGTGNLSEDYIGYDTKGGDALADIFPIGDLLKSEVYAMLEHFRDIGVITEAMINRTPSAGLWAGQTDEDEIGFSYAAMEPAIRYLIRNQGLDDPAAHPEVYRFVWERHLAHKHKHEAPPAIRLRGEDGEIASH